MCGHNFIWSKDLILNQKIQKNKQFFIKKNFLEVF